MTNLKWVDVANMYQFSNIDIQIGVGIRPFRGASIHPDGTKRGLFLDSKGHFVRTTSCCIDEYTPILRHLEDMTEAEAREWFKMEEGKEWPEGGYMEHQTARERWIFWLKSIRVSSIAEMSPIFSVSEFHWLISKGFDMFGLIEAGEAIRKEAGNG